MPCLDEAETLATCIKKAQSFLKRAGISGEVLIADNGSTDGSQVIATSLGARVVAVPSKGYGAALAGGIDAARGTYVIMGDADDSYDFENLELFVAELRAGNELVMGNRFKGGIKPGAMPPLHRYLGNPVLTFFGRLFFSSPAGDFHCGLRGFNRNAILKLNLRTSGMEFASEMVVKATLAEIKIAEVPTTLSPDGRTRAPHLRSWRDGWRHLRFLLLYSPRWLFLYPGIFLLIVGMLSAIFLLPGPINLTPDIRIDVHTLFIGAMAFIVGVQAITFSMIARRFATRYGFIPASSRFNKLLERLTLERILIASAILVLIGSISIFYVVLDWAVAGFGNLDYTQTMRGLIVGGACVVSGLQMAMSGFLSSVIGIPLQQSDTPNKNG